MNKLLEDKLGEDKNTSEQNPESSISRSRSRSPLNRNYSQDRAQKIIENLKLEINNSNFRESIVNDIHTQLLSNKVDKKQCNEDMAELEENLKENIENEINIMIDVLSKHKQGVLDNIVDIDDISKPALNRTEIPDNDNFQKKVENFESIDTILTKKIEELQSKKKYIDQYIKQSKEVAPKQSEEQIINSQKDFAQTLESVIEDIDNIEDNIKNLIDQKLKEVVANEIDKFNKDKKVLDKKYIEIEKQLNELCNLEDQTNKRKEQNFSAPQKNDSFVSEKKVNTLINPQDEKNNVPSVESSIEDKIFEKQNQIKKTIDEFIQADDEKKIQLIDKKERLEKELKQLQRLDELQELHNIVNNAHKKSEALLNDVVQGQGFETPRKQDNSPYINTSTDRSYYTNATHGTYDSAKNTLKMFKEAVCSY